MIMEYETIAIGLVLGGFLIGFYGVDQWMIQNKWPTVSFVGGAMMGYGAAILVSIGTGTPMLFAPIYLLYAVIVGIVDFIFVTSFVC